MAPFKRRGEEAGDPFVGVRALTDALREAMLEDVVHVEDEGLAPLVEELDVLYARRVATEAGGRLAATVGLARALNAFMESDPERVAAFRQDLAAYKANLDSAGTEDRVVCRHHAQPTLGANLAFALEHPEIKDILLPYLKDMFC